MQECRFITPSQDAGMEIYNSFSGCRHHHPDDGMGYSLICLRSLDPKISNWSLINLFTSNMGRLQPL
jgi:hypothetical protein